MSIDDELLGRLADVEDVLVERKESFSDDDVRKTVVAFANGVRSGLDGVLFLGAKPDGTPTGKLGDVDKLQRQKVRPAISKCYPPIETHVYALKSAGMDVIAVVVPGSPARPHFCGKPYVRSGSESRQASDEEIRAMLAMRISKVSFLSAFLGTPVTVEKLANVGAEASGAMFGAGRVLLVGVNEHFIRLRTERPEKPGYRSREFSFALDRVRIEWECDRDQPLLTIAPR